MTKPRITDGRNFNVWCDLDLAEKVTDAHHAVRMNLSEWVREAIIEKLERDERAAERKLRKAVEAEEAERREIQ